jgi:chitin disaccharide deacetylase
MEDRWLIVNADDFGSTEGIDRGIVDCHLAGAVTSASLMATGKAAAHAARLAADLPELSVGLHWVGDRPGVAVVDLADAGAVAEELARQLALFEELLGRAPTHLDSHHHLHFDERVMEVFLAAAEPLGIPVRGGGRARFVGDFYGQSEDGQTDLARVGLEALEGILRREAEAGGQVEICCHPGHDTAAMRSAYTFEREAELRTLTDPRLERLVGELGFHLVNRRHLGRAVPTAGGSPEEGTIDGSSEGAPSPEGGPIREGR